MGRESPRRRMLLGVDGISVRLETGEPWDSTFNSSRRGKLVIVREMLRGGGFLGPVTGKSSRIGYPDGRSSSESGVSMREASKSSSSSELIDEPSVDAESAIGGLTRG